MRCGSCLTVILLTLSSALYAQKGVDSLLNLLQAEMVDSNKAKLLLQLGAAVMDDEPDKAVGYFKQAEELSSRINYKDGFFKSRWAQSEILNVQSRYAEMLDFEQKTLEWVEQNPDSFYLAIVNLNMAITYRFLNDYEKALSHSERGRDIFARMGNARFEGQVNDIMQSLYAGLHQYRKAVFYGRNAVKNLEETGDVHGLSYVYNNLALNYIHLREFDSATIYLNKAERCAQESNATKMLITSDLSRGYIHLLQSRYDSMKAPLDRALVMARDIRVKEFEGLAIWGLSNYYLGKKLYNAARKYSDSALQIATQYTYPDLKLKANTTLSQIAFAMQDIELGNYYAEQTELIRDSILNESITRNTILIEKKYETEKKENRIKLQESQLRQKDTMNYVLIGSTVALLIILFQLYRIYRSRRKLQEQRIRDLETEKQLLATQSLLKGQEDERSRLAKDLHDGLGGLLSGVKLQLGAMKGNLILSSENAIAFDRALNKLDESIGEMRRVAHNMMPEALLNLGLQQAISDYCDHLSRNQQFSINCEMHGLEKRMDSTVEVVLYRIVQELLHNAVRHANATSILVQVMRQADGTVAITVEDNGRGFDSSKIDTVKSSGLQNIYSRVKYLNGTMDIKSAPGKGTSVYVECKIDGNGEN